MTDRPYFTFCKPSKKLDGQDLFVGICSCGDYRSAPTTAPTAKRRAALHHKAKHS